MKKLSILMVADFIFNDDKGGSGRLVVELSKNLVKRGHTVYILARRVKRNFPYKEEIGGVKVYRYDVNYLNPITYVISSLIQSSRTLRQIMQQVEFDIVCMDHPLPALGAMLSGCLKGIPKLYNFASSWPEEYEIKTGRKGAGVFFRKLIEKKVLAGMEKIIVLSNFSKSNILGLYKVEPEKIEIIPAGVDTGRFIQAPDRNEIRAKLGIPADKLILLSVRNFKVRTGLDNLIQAMPEVIKKNNDTLLFIGGGGFLENKLKGLVKTLNLENYIKFTGYIEEELLPLYYQAADIFVLPTKYLEGFGLVTLEALACGTPVLGTPVGGTIEILKKFDERFLFASTDAPSMAKLITEFIDEYRGNPGEIRQRCRQFIIENYSWEKMAFEVEKLFERQGSTLDGFEYVACNLCAAHQAKILIRRGSSNIVQCKICGLIYENPRLSESEALKNVISDGVLVEHRKEVWFNSKIKLFQHNLEKIEKYSQKGKLLDVGCGYGTFLKIAQDNGWQVMGIEIAGSAYKYAEEVLGLNVLKVPLREAGLPHNYFDVITIWDVLNVLYDPVAELTQAQKVLKEGGLIALRIQNALFHVPIHKFFQGIGNQRIKLNLKPAILHRYSFSSRTIRKILEKCGFEDVRVSVSEFTAGDPYGSAGALGSLGVIIIKKAIFYLSVLIYYLSGGKLILAPSMLVFARKP